MKRKLTALLLSVVLLLGVVSLPGSAAFVDVDKATKYQESIEVLVALGMLKGYEDNSFRPENTITRAEFATVITRMLGLESIVGGASAAGIFTDMKIGGGEHWASGYIKVAYDLGIILGMGDGTFAPDNPVTYEQAIKMMVCALGYEAAATELGGWPAGYIAQADMLNMTKSIQVDKTNTAASRGMVAQILYNSLEVPIAEKQANGSVNVTKKTILGSKLGCARINNFMVAQVDGTESITDSGIRLQSGELAFSRTSDPVTNEPFLYGDVLGKAEAKALMGSYVKGYYKVGNEEESHRIIYLTVSASKSEELELLSEEIYEYNSDLLELAYYIDEEKDDAEEVLISEDAQLIYNGSIYDYRNGTSDECDLSKWLDPDSDDFVDGQIRLVENTGDKKVDTIFIEDYEIYIAKGPVMTNDRISSNNYVIYDNYVSGKNIRIDPYSPSVIAEFYDANTLEEIKIEDIKAMHVVSVAANVSETKFKVYISKKTVKGKIEEFTNDGEYVIDGKTYQTTKAYQNLVDTEVISPKTGLEGTFYLDQNDRICAAKITQEDAGAYAYVTNAGIDDDRAILKLMNLSGTPSKPTKVKCATSVKVNGRTTTEPQDILDALESAASKIAANSEATNTTYAQLIRYVKNSSGQITKITTVSLSGSAVQIGKNENLDKLVTGVEKTQYTYTNSSGFSSQVFVNSSTLVLVVPDDRLAEDEYKRSTATSYFKNGTTYDIEAYDINASSVAKVVVVYNADRISNETAVDYTTPVRIVTKVSTGLSKINDEDIVYHIEVYESGTIKKYETESTGAPYNTIKVGDVIRFGLNGDGQINKLGRGTNTHELDVNRLVPEFKYDRGLTSGNPVLYTDGEYFFKTVYGTVYTISDESVFIAPAEVDTTGDAPTLDTSAAVGFRITSGVKMYYVRLSDNGNEVNTLSNLNNVIEFGDLKNVNATHMFAQAYAGTLKVLVVVVDERTAP